MHCINNQAVFLITSSILVELLPAKYDSLYDVSLKLVSLVV